MSSFFEEITRHCDCLDAVADPCFSKRTDSPVDHDRRRGASAGAYSGHDAQTGSMPGMLHVSEHPEAF